MDIGAIVGVLGGLTGLASLIGALVTWRKARAETGKVEADTASVLIATTTELVEGLRCEMRSLRERVESLEVEREQLIERIGALEDELEKVRCENEELRRSNIELVKQMARQ
jgi:predicted nuclease with TOPRIM domain